MSCLNWIQLFIYLSIDVLLFHFFFFYVFHHVEELIFSLSNLLLVNFFNAQITGICYFLFITYLKFSVSFTNLHMFLKSFWNKFSWTLLTRLQLCFYVLILSNRIKNLLIRAWSFRYWSCRFLNWLKLLDIYISVFFFGNFALRFYARKRWNGFTNVYVLL